VQTKKRALPRTASKWTEFGGSLPATLEVSGVYVIRHRESGRVYVGSSVRCRTRLIHHLNRLRAGLHHSKYLQRAWAKYGEAAFVVALLESAPRPDLLAREQHWIERLDSFHNGFNGRPKAEANYGVVWSEETNQRRRESNRRAWSDEKLRARLSRKFKGQFRSKPTAETPAKLSAAIKQYLASHPEAAAARIATLRAPQNQAKRTAAWRAAMRRPEGLRALRAKIEKARISSKRIPALREAAFAKLQRRHPELASREEFESVCRSLYASGASAREIGRRFQVDHKAIASILRRHGVQVSARYRKGQQVTFSKLTEKDVRMIHERLAAGATNVALATEYGVSSSVISEVRTGKAWRHLGLPAIPSRR
jgi:group I intron endonuclease